MAFERKCTGAKRRASASHTCGVLRTWRGNTTSTQIRSVIFGHDLLASR